MAVWDVLSTITIITSAGRPSDVGCRCGHFSPVPGQGLGQGRSGLRQPAERSAVPPDGESPCRHDRTDDVCNPGRPGCAIECRTQAGEWNRAGDPDQVKLEAFLAATEQILRSRCEQLTGPLAIRLDIGLPPATPLLDQRDLDNYLFPLAVRMSKTTGTRLVSLWGTKQRSDASFARIESAVPIVRRLVAPITRSAPTGQARPPPSNSRSTTSSTSAASLPDGPVRLQLSFTVGPRRNWLNLWKPTIDALGQILGSTTPGQSWHPQDGRIVELGLHCRVEQALGNEVLITIEANTQQM